MTRTLLALLLVMTACGGKTLKPDEVHRVPADLCTSVSCVATPCTTGCLFGKRPANGCQGELPKEVSGRSVLACQGLCGFAIDYFAPSSGHTASGGCLVYTPPTNPACGPAQCSPDCLGTYSADPTFGADQAVICATACLDGSRGTVEDMGPGACRDLSMPDDLSEHVDGGSTD